MNTFAIVGGSYAAVQAAISARQHGYDGRIVVFSAEKQLPYHRPPLSKAFLSSEMPISRLWLRSEAFYQQHDIELALGEAVTELNLEQKSLRTNTQSPFYYDSVLLATGASALPLPWQENPLKGVYHLRDLADAQQLKAAISTARKAVVIGGGFIGLEIASTLATQGVDTTVIERGHQLAGRVVSPYLSSYLQTRHEKQNVRICLASQVVGFRHHQAVEGVVLADGRVLEADLVVVGIGAKPNTQLVPALDPTGTQGVRVTNEAKTIVPHVLAAGDCACVDLHADHPHRWLRLESVNAANELGKAAGAVVAGQSEPFVTAPWFWSDQYDLKLQMVGLALPDDRLVIRGQPDSTRFSVFHLRPDGVVGAVQSVNRPAEHMLARRLVHEKIAIAPPILKDDSINLKDYISQQNAK